MISGKNTDYLKVDIWRKKLNFLWWYFLLASSSLAQTFILCHGSYFIRPIKTYSIIIFSNHVKKYGNWIFPGRGSPSQSAREVGQPSARHQRRHRRQRGGGHRRGVRHSRPLLEGNLGPTSQNSTHRKIVYHMERKRVSFLFLFWKAFYFLRVEFWEIWFRLLLYMSWCRGLSLLSVIDEMNIASLVLL